ncbi:uncharacterized protein LOC124918025 [Impatiens glandulifera]|uniref:uncharacterized protein LOC124918025 n=1 Tax=Impatiens glandulifera TaxID=253017 RepID=UPI001FB16BEE|nr:uncharacterized protein LOC124918025 [Impatiens glandulifera]
MVSMAAAALYSSSSKTFFFHQKSQILHSIVSFFIDFLFHLHYHLLLPSQDFFTPIHRFTAKDRDRERNLRNIRPYITNIIKLYFKVTKNISPDPNTRSQTSLLSGGLAD